MSAPSRFLHPGLRLGATVLLASLQAPSLAAGSGTLCSPTVGVVCEQIQGQGATYGSSFGPDVLYAGFTVTGSPYQSGVSPVAASGVVAGTGVFGGVSASGYFGQAHISASAQDTNPHNSIDDSRVSTQGNVAFGDGFTVGSSDVEARITIAVDGGVSVGADGGLDFQLFDVTPYQNASLVPDLQLGLSYNRSSASQTYDFVFQSGHTYDFFFSMEADASAAEDFLNDHPDAIADLGNTGTINFDVVTPGQSLSFISGHDYSSDAVGTDPTGPTTPGDPGSSAVPEPPVVTLVFTGLAGLAFIARRRSTRTASRVTAVATA